jgi:hypothetical protein
MIVWLRAATTGAVLLLAGCASSAADAPAADAVDAVATAHHAWLAGRPADYRFVWQQTCFCLPEAVQPIRITVHGDAITSATGADGNPVSADVRSGLKTIDALYAYVLAKQHAGAEVRFSSTAHGVPDQVYVDPNPRVADDEFRVKISAFEALP